MKVKLKSADAINLHLKSQTLFLNMPETYNSLEWNSKLPGVQEIKPEPKGFASYNEAKAMLSTTHIRIPPQYRLTDGLSSQPVKPRPDPIEKDKKLGPNKGLPSFESIKKSKLYEQSVGTKTPIILSQIEKSPRVYDSSATSRHVGFQSLNMSSVSAAIKKKLNWHVDHEALLSKKRISSVTKLIKSIPNLEDSSSKEITATLLHLTDYFESMLQRLFFENKGKFTSSAYFKALFSEEYYKEMPRRLHTEDFNKPTPVTIANKVHSSGAIHNLIAPPAAKKISNLISTLLISPGLTPTASDRMLPRFSSGSVGSAEKQRKSTNINMDPSSEFFRRHSLLLKSYKHRYVREWTENVTFLQPMEQFTVLVVDDVPDQVNNAIDILTSWNEIACEGAYDGLEAVKMVRNKMNEGKMYHLILTDLTMPHDGFETTKDIRKEEATRNTKPKYCIIGVTAEGLSSISDVKAKQSGMDDTITKPLRRTILANILTKRAAELGIDLQLTDNEA